MYAQLLEKHKKQITIFELYVRNFPPNIRQSQVANFFKKYGKVKSVRLLPSKTREEPFAIVVFFDFQTMLNVYLKFAHSKSNDQFIYVEISRSTLLICMKCNKTGHWKNQCKQKLKSYCFQKSLQQIITHRQPISSLEFNRNFSSSKWTKQNEQQEQENLSLQYFCSELQQNPQPQSIDKNVNIKQSQIIPGRLKNQEQDAITNYAEQSLVFDSIQKQMIFALIDPSSPSTGFMNQQEINKLQRLWNENWFYNPPQHIGAFVKIIKTSTKSIFC